MAGLLLRLLKRQTDRATMATHNVLCAMRRDKNREDFDFQTRSNMLPPRVPVIGAFVDSRSYILAFLEPRTRWEGENVLSQGGYFCGVITEFSTKGSAGNVLLLNRI